MALSIYMERGPLYQQEIITDYILTSSLTIQDRCDTAFASTKFKAFLTGTKYKYNVSPYTVFHIQDTNDNTYVMVGKSTCNKYFNETNTYVHDFELMEGTAILSGFIVGTKSFSTSGTHKQDKQKISILLELMEAKYGWDFDLVGVNDMTSEIEYSYGAGTTLFDILSDMAAHYNKRVFVSNIVASQKTIEISFLNLNANSSIDVSNNLITSIQYSQNDNQFCKYLETEASNVVDRTTITHYRNLTCKSDDINLESKTAYIELPTPVENVDAFGIQNLVSPGLIGFTGTIYCGGAVISDGWEGQVTELLDENPALQKAYDEYLYKYFTQEEYEQLECKYENDYFWDGSQPFVGLKLRNRINNNAVIVRDFDLSAKLLPFDKWNLLTDQNKVGYAYFKPGDNKIYNLSAEYKNDLWNAILGNSRSGLLDFTFPQSDNTYLIQNGIRVRIFFASSPAVEGTNNHTNTPMYYKWYADANVITDPYIVDTKNVSNLDGQSFDFSQSYNNGASLIDYDLIGEYMNITNKSIGRNELQIEYDITDSNIPKSRYKVIYDNIQWYVSSVLTTFGIEKTTSIVNLVRNYNKKADCIGVETQYKATKNPLNMVVTRPLFFEDDSFDYDDSKCYFFKITFTYSDDSSKTLYKLASIQKSSRDMILYCETDDQFSFANNVKTKWIATVKKFTTNQTDYVDSNNELEYVQIDIVTLPDLEIETAYDLPNYSGEEEVVLSTDTKLVYKDARERLTFTIKITL